MRTCKSLVYIILFLMITASVAAIDVIPTGDFNFKNNYVIKGLPGLNFTSATSTLCFGALCYNSSNMGSAYLADNVYMFLSGYVISFNHTKMNNTIDARISTTAISLQTNITNEASARSAADTSINASLTTEISNRQSASTSLATNITTADNRATSVNSSLNVEISNRQNTSTSLQTNITAADNRVTSVNSSLNTEISTRGSSITSLNNTINTLNSSKLTATATTCNAGNASVFNGSNFACTSISTGTGTGTGNLTGSGTAGYIPLWSNGTNVASSTIQNTATLTIIGSNTANKSILNLSNTSTQALWSSDFQLINITNNISANDIRGILHWADIIGFPSGAPSADYYATTIGSSVTFTNIFTSTFNSTVNNLISAAGAGVVPTSHFLIMSSLSAINMPASETAWDYMTVINLTQFTQCRQFALLSSADGITATKIYLKVNSTAYTSSTASMINLSSSNAAVNLTGTGIFNITSYQTIPAALRNGQDNYVWVVTSGGNGTSDPVLRTAGIDCR
jgi:hypothetical protein